MENDPDVLDKRATAKIATNKSATYICDSGLLQNIKSPQVKNVLIMKLLKAVFPSEHLKLLLDICIFSWWKTLS